MNSRELVERALELLLAKDMAAFAGLWAEDGVLEFPFAASLVCLRTDHDANLALPAEMTARVFEVYSGPANPAAV